MSSRHANVLPHIKEWLAQTETKIQSFWLYADWRGWARFEIFMALEAALGGDCLVTHSNDDFFSNEVELVDILIEPHDSSQGSVAIVLRCEKVNENEGSFERFVEQYDGDWRRLKEALVEGGFEGCKVLLVGFSGEAMGNGIDEFQTEPQPTRFVEGDVNGWVKGFDVTK